MRYLTLTLTLMLALVHAELWFGSSGVPRVLDLGTRLEAQRTANEAHRQRNQQMAAEVRDLREGLEMIEEKARFELGMIRPDEILVQISAGKP
jgi:cell division protein FtsB